MDYELLLKLKKAGFPMGGGGICGIEHDHMENYKKDCVHVNEPILEELIDWCIEKQPNELSSFTLNHTYVEADGEGGYLWEAYFDGGIDGKNQFYETGKTKKEAVAKLGLALHKEV